jgi:hypothetical protein
MRSQRIALTNNEIIFLDELRKGDGLYYVAQERAFATGIAGNWPPVIAHPTSTHGRLVRRYWPKKGTP